MLTLLKRVEKVQRNLNVLQKKCTNSRGGEAARLPQTPVRRTIVILWSVGQRSCLAAEWRNRRAAGFSQTGPRPAPRFGG